MQTSIKILTICVLAVSPLCGWADETPGEEPHSSITGNLALTSNYMFRGISQTWDKPAIQGGFDWTHPSGFYLGTWASNVSDNIYNNASVEWDLYGGYNGSINDDLTYNVSLLGYFYPGGKYNAAPSEKYDTVEAAIGMTYKFLNVKYSRTLTDFYGANGNTITPDNGDSKGSDYIEANVNYEIMEKLLLGLHIGRQKVKNYGSLDYSDYKISLAKEFGGFNFTAAYSNTNADPALYTYTNGVGDSKDVSNGVFFVTVGKTF